MAIALQPDTDILTPRCALEPLLAAHAECLYAGLSDPELYTWLPGSPPVNAESLRARYQKLETRKSPDESQLWLNWALRETNTGRYIGTLEATVSEERHVQIAYFVFPEFQRQGYASEACGAMLAHLFATYALQKATLLCDTRNQASISLAERLGFTQRERIANADFFKGKSSDEFLYELSPASSADS